MVVSNKEIMNRFSTKHGNKFVYDMSTYSGMRTPMKITCPLHSVFIQTPENHMKGSGCPKCGIDKSAQKRKMSTKDFVEKVDRIHLGKYGYENVLYNGMHTRVSISCPDHGVFYQTPAKHKQGQGCPKCGIIQNAEKQKKSTQYFVRKSNRVHNEKYNYESVSYKRSSEKVKITCLDHGTFLQSPNNHMNGNGCPKCGRWETTQKQKMPKEYFLGKSTQTHSGKYSYEGIKYNNNKTKINIICPNHGEFLQTPEKHLKGQGCPKCANVGPSIPEQELYDFTVKRCPDAAQSDRRILNGLELDIYIPSKNLAIEYCGLYWHSEEKGKAKNYHYDKWLECKNQGIHLLTVFEDEALDKVKNVILSLTGNQEKGHTARKQEIRIVPKKEATAFFHKYHLQGSCGKKVTYGLYFDSVLTAAMAFGAPSRQSKHQWELRRFCTDRRNHVGAASRLWKAFLKDESPDSVVSLSDRRYFTGGMYSILGFEWGGEIRPDYSYVKGLNRFHKSGFRKSCIKRKLPEYYDEKLTEREMMLNAKFSRIWDCGKDRWVWNKTLDKGIQHV